MDIKKINFCVFIMATSLFDLYAGNLANPTVIIPPARLAIGASYDLNGTSLTNRAVPALVNRVQARVSYAPFSYVNFGIDAGASQIEIASETTPNDTFGVFHGGFGFSGGGHLKLGTPFFFNNLVSAIGVLQGTYFSSKNTVGTVYGGTEATGIAGLQFHVHSFGYISLGPQLDLIQGKTTDYSGAQGRYSNVNNLRGWLAIDFFPEEQLGAKNLFYISCEMSVSPKVKFNARAPLQEFSFAVSIGSVTPRLYGEESDVEWKP
jgi:hypothetical protein